MTTGRINQVSIFRFLPLFLLRRQRHPRVKETNATLTRRAQRFLCETNLLKSWSLFFWLHTVKTWCARETRMDAFTSLASPSQLQFATAFDFPSHSCLDNGFVQRSAQFLSEERKNSLYNPSKQCNCVVSLHKRPSFAAQSLPHSPHN